jgi:hypothetical protein
MAGKEEEQEDTIEWSIACKALVAIAVQIAMAGWHILCQYIPGAPCSCTPKEIIKRRMLLA